MLYQWSNHDRGGTTSTSIIHSSTHLKVMPTIQSTNQSIGHDSAQFAVRVEGSEKMTEGGWLPAQDSNYIIPYLAPLTTLCWPHPGQLFR